MFSGSEAPGLTSVTHIGRVLQQGIFRTGEASALGGRGSGSEERGGFCGGKSHPHPSPQIGRALGSDSKPPANGRSDLQCQVLRESPVGNRRADSVSRAHSLLEAEQHIELLERLGGPVQPVPQDLDWSSHLF